MKRLWIVVLVVVLTAVDVAHSTVLERKLTLAINDQTVRETEEILVEVASREDVVRWRSYSIEMDEHIELESLTARVLSGDGSELLTVPPASYLREESVGFGLYTSRWRRVVPLQFVRPGQRLWIRHVRNARMPYPSMRVALSLAAPQELVELEVICDRELSWRLVAAHEQFRVETDGSEGGAQRLTVRSRTSIPEGGSAQVQLIWHPSPTWSSVAGWYGGLLAGVPRSDAVRRVARETCAGAGGRRQCLERLARVVSRDVRYEAVSIGPGGWIPSPPEEVLARHWGDCKDKSMLLKALLEAVEIPSVLALARAGESGTVDPLFPSPQQFNHTIVAVPVHALSVSDEDSVAGGYLFYDPTVEHGGIEWLNPAVQGRRVLPVDGEARGLVELPYVRQADGWDARINGQVQEDGVLRGHVALTLTGRSAVQWLDSIERSAPARRAALVREALSTGLPLASDLDQSAWRAPARAVPTVELTARLELAGFLRVDRRGDRWIAVRVPEPLARKLDDLGRWPAEYRARWRIEHGYGDCRPRAEDRSTLSKAGRVSLGVNGGNGWIEIDAAVQWSGGQGASVAGAARQLRLELRRASRERLLLDCGPPASVLTPG